MWSLRFLMIAVAGWSLSCGGVAPPAEVAVSDVEDPSLSIVRILSTEVHNGNEAALGRLRVLAESGQAAAQLMLAASHANVEVFRDDAESAKWYLAAACQGLPVAQASIGVAYMHGRGVEQDTEKGLFWLRLAADQGHWLAVATLGDHHRGKRWDEPGDFVQAYRWYTVGLGIAEGDEREAIAEGMRRRRSQIAERMTAEEIAEAERLAAGWVRRDWSEVESRLEELG